MTVNGVVLDIGYPAWMFERLAKEPEKKVRQRLRKRGRAREGQNASGFSAWESMVAQTPQGTQRKRARVGENHRTCGVSGRTNYARKKEARALNDAAQGKETPLQKRFIPRNTIRSERT